ncbi:MAG: DNA helicase RecQ [Spirochaetota bacterium]
MDSIQQTLRRSFGFDSFRPHQEEIVRAMLARRDVFAALPTGGGKSLCYQLPALMTEGLTVVVSPLIALMHDQVSAALQNGLPAAFLNSTLTPEEAGAVWGRLERRKLRLLYVSPERLALEGFRAHLQHIGVELFAIDEAHCISEWGHEFRPDYRALAVLRDEFPDTAIAAFTATATDHVQADVIRLLGLREPLAVRGDFDRREIFYSVIRKEKPADQIRSFVVNRRGNPGIVYRATRKSVEQTAAALKRCGVRAEPYHAGLSDEERRLNQDRFVRDEVDVVVATIAFGMGIDKSNVRWVLHGDLPKSLEAYYQESGRAGRDGEAAEACLLYGPQDIATIRYHIDRMEIPEERERAETSLRGMLRYVNAGVCRRIQLLAHFGQEHPGDCAGCDVCAGDHETVDRSVEAQKAMSAVARTGERFGAHHIADIVAGCDTERVRKFGHDRLPTFGVGSDQARDHWLDLLQDLEAAGHLRRRDGARSGLSISQSGRRILFGKEAFLAATSIGARAGASGARDGRAGEDASAATAGPFTAAAPGTAPAEPELPAADQESLFQCLRALRRRLAREQGVPPYVVFSDKSLKSMVRLRPTTEAAFLGVNGVGEAKAARYGEVFLAAIAEFLATGACGDAGAGE